MKRQDLCTDVVVDSLNKLTRSWIFEGESSTAKVECQWGVVFSKDLVCSEPKSFRQGRCLGVFERDRLTSNTTFLWGLDEIDCTMSNHLNARDLLYHWEKEKNGRIASAYAVFFVEENFSSQNLEAINALLLTAAPSRLTEWSMVALLRSSFSAKHLLPGWLPFFLAVANELKDNARVSKLLAGLAD